MPKPEHEIMYCHSMCCGAHWELVVKDGTEWDLECEKCGQPVGSGVEVTGPNMEGCECGECKKGGN